MIGKLEPEDRAVCSKGFVFKGESIFSLSFSLSFGRFFAIVFLGSFFLLSHSLFVSTFSHYFLSFFLFSPSFFFVSSLFLSFFLFFCFVFPNDRPLSMLLKGVDGYRWNGCLWEVPVLEGYGFLLRCNRLIGVVKEVWLISRLRLINLEVDLN